MASYRYMDAPVINVSQNRKVCGIYRIQNFFTNFTSCCTEAKMRCLKDYILQMCWVYLLILFLSKFFCFFVCLFVCDEFCPVS